MRKNSKMVHVRMPISLVKSIDDFVKCSNEHKSRSSFIVKAVEQNLKRERYFSAISKFSGFLAAEDTPHWKDEEAIDKWVRENRKIDVESIGEKWQS